MDLPRRSGRTQVVYFSLPLSEEFPQIARQVISPTEPDLMSEASPYDYELPKAAASPSSRWRGGPTRRLMVIDRARQSIRTHHMRDLPELFQPEDCLVINDTRVVPARLVGCAR